MLLQSLTNRSGSISSRRPMRKGAGRRSGAAVVELALTLSILFGVLYGTIAFGYYFYIKNTLEGAAREGCRAGIVAGATTANCTSAILTQLQVAGLVSASASVGGSGPYTIGNYTITFYNNTTGSAVSDISTVPVGNTLIASVSAQWSAVGSGFSYMNIIGSGKTVSTMCSMRKEG